MTNHTDELDAADLRALAQVRSVHARLDPVPADLVDRVKYALTVRALQAEVAELVDASLVATRGVDAQRTETITFAHGSLSLMVTIGVGDGPHARVDGWVTSGGAEVEVVSGESSQSAVADANGRFVLEQVPRGPVYFVIRVTGSSRPPVVTPTIDL